MCVGSLLVLGGLVLMIYNLRQQRYAEKASNAMLELLQEEIAYVQGTANENCKKTDFTEINGVKYLGILELPTLQVTLPIQADWSYEKLRESPCVYDGSIRGRNLVLLGHNYRCHFGPIDRLRPGDELALTDSAGNTFSYIVDELTTLDDKSIEEMVNSNYDLSLFTCNYDGSMRITVRCSLHN